MTNPPPDTTDYLATARSSVFGHTLLYVLAISGGVAFVTAGLGQRGMTVSVNTLFDWTPTRVENSGE